MSSCTTLTVCHNRPLLRSKCLYIYFQLTLNVIQQASSCVLNVPIFTSAVRPFHFPDCAEGSEEKNVNITGKTASSVVCGSWHCLVVEGVEECGGRVKCVGVVKVCGTGVQGTGGRSKVCGERGGGVWEGWRDVCEG